MAAVAEAAGVPYRTYQEIESGGNWPRVETLEAIARALSVSVSRLFLDPSLEPTPSEALAVLEKALNKAPESLPAEPATSHIPPISDDPRIIEIVEHLRERPFAINAVLAAARGRSSGPKKPKKDPTL